MTLASTTSHTTTGPSNTMQPLQSNDAKDYRVQLTTLTEASQQMQQCWPLLAATMWATPCHPVTKTPAPTSPACAIHPLTVDAPNLMLLQHLPAITSDLLPHTAHDNQHSQNPTTTMYSMSPMAIELDASTSPDPTTNPSANHNNDTLQLMTIDEKYAASLAQLHLAIKQLEELNANLALFLQMLC